jgi:hypothetical protein
MKADERRSSLRSELFFADLRLSAAHLNWSRLLTGSMASDNQ